MLASIGYFMMSFSALIFLIMRIIEKPRSKVSIVGWSLILADTLLSGISHQP